VEALLVNPFVRQPPLPRGPKLLALQGGTDTVAISVSSISPPPPHNLAPLALSRIPRRGTPLCSHHRGACTYDCHFCPSCRVTYAVATAAWLYPAIDLNNETIG